MSQHNDTTRTSVLTTAVSKATVRLVPLLGLIYFISYLDRVNIAFAASSMKADIGLSTAAYGLGAGIFFITYCLFEVPSNMLMYRLGARFWIARIMLTWGVISVLMMFVQNETWFYVLRLLLGAAEAGLLPGIVLYLSHWFPAGYRARVSAGFLVALPIAMVFGSPFSTWIIEVGHGAFGLQGWQVMFFVEGLPAVLIGFYVLAKLPSKPQDARWLSNEEREALTQVLAAEDRESPASAIGGLIAALREPRIYILAVIGFCSSFGIYAFSFFLPQLVGDMQASFGIQLSPMQIALLTAIPFAAAVISMLIISRHADRSGRPIGFAAVLLAISGTALICSVFPSSPAIKITLLSVVVAAALPVTPLLYHLPKYFAGGATFAAGAALVSTLANLSGLAAPALTGVLREASGDFNSSLWVMGGLLFAGALLLILLGRLLRSAKLYRQPASTTAADTAQGPKTTQLSV